MEVRRRVFVQLKTRAKIVEWIRMRRFKSLSNIILFAILGYFIYARIFKKPIAPTFTKPITPLPPGEYTPQELRKYNGVEDPHILLAVKRKIYDVTAGAMFYGPRGPYKNFGGRDASRALALGSFEDDMFVDSNGPIDDLANLDAEQKAALDDWVSHFDGKYIDAGTLVENDAKRQTSGLPMKEE